MLIYLELNSWQGILVSEEGFSFHYDIFSDDCGQLCGDFENNGN